MHALEQYKSAAGSSERSTRTSMPRSQNVVNFVPLAATAGWNPGYDPIAFDHVGPDASPADVVRLAKLMVEDIATMIRDRTIEIENIDEKFLKDRANSSIERNFNPPAQDGLRRVLGENFAGSPLGLVREELECLFPGLDLIYIPITPGTPPRPALYEVVEKEEGILANLDPLVTMAGMGPRLGGAVVDRRKDHPVVTGRLGGPPP